MRKIFLILAAVIMAAPICPLTAQQQGFGRGPGDGRGPGVERGGAPRLETIAKDLDLTEEQAAKWQATIDNHFQSIEATRKQMADLREEFNRLADTEKPDLERLGEIALTLHREVRDSNPQRQQLITELKGMLTPEQVERFDTLVASRQFSRPQERPVRRERPAGEPDQN
jgi:Spy/CpxP family protein refolding chaperone